MDRDSRGRFVKGNTVSAGGNGGRPKGLAERARAATNDGEDIIAFFVAVFRGEHGAELADRMAAASWLADRGWGKATQILDVTTSGEIRVYTGVDVERV